MARRYVSNAPCCEQKQTDMGEIGIAVGMALFSNLNEANHWYKHDQIPEPAAEQVRPFPSENDCRPSHGEKQSDSDNYLPSWQHIVWVRIKNRETCRPQCLPDIDHVARECVVGAPEQRQRGERACSTFLYDECDDTGDQLRK